MSEEGASPPANKNEDTIFGKITRGEIKSDFVYEDDQCVVIRDLNPTAPTHLLVLPRKPIRQLSEAEECDEGLLGHLLIAAAKAAKKEGLTDFRTVINNGKEACQSVYHLHIHVIGGKQLSWPPGC